MGSECSVHEVINTYKIFSGNLKWKGSPEGPGLRRDNNIKMDRKGIRWEGVNQNDVALNYFIYL